MEAAAAGGALTRMFGLRRTVLRRGGKLHVGCGRVALPGWINIDNQRSPAVDYVVDVRRGLPFADLDFVYAEHFIEHLDFDDAARFLQECRRVLKPEGVLRLTTPSLDWVVMTQYHPSEWASDDEAVRDSFWINKAFRGFGHRFLYNWPSLAASLHHAGFGVVEPLRYGESRHEALRGIERHEPYPDTPELPHLIVVEASGVGGRRSETLVAGADDLRKAVRAG